MSHYESYRLILSKLHMTRRIQITVDDELVASMKAQAAQLGLSLSAFSRIALIAGLQRQKSNALIKKAIADVEQGRMDQLSLAKFNKQLDDL